MVLTLRDTNILDGDGINQGEEERAIAAALFWVNMCTMPIPRWYVESTSSSHLNFRFLWGFSGVFGFFSVSVGRVGWSGWGSEGGCGWAVAAGADELENVEIAEQEAREKAYKEAKKKPGGMDDR